MQSCGSGGEPPSSKNCNTLKQKGTGTLSNYQNATKNAGKIVCGCPQDKIQSIINGDCEAVKKRIEAIKEAYEKNQKIVIYKCDELSGRMSIADVCFENLKYYDYNLQGDSISIDPAKYTVMKTTNSAKGYEYWAIVFEGDVLELRVPTTEPDAEKKIRALAKWLGESGANETTKPASFPIKGTQLKEIFPGTDIKRCEEVAKLINKYSDKFEINTPEKMALFLGQIGYESNSLNAMGEQSGELPCYTSKNKAWDISQDGWIAKKKWSEIPFMINCEDYTPSKRGQRKHPDWNSVNDVPEKYICSKKNLATVAGMALFNYVYRCEGGNSDVASGDGFRYRGHGVLQLTWKKQYAEFNDWLVNNGFPNDYKQILTNPDEAFKNKEIDVLSGMWYWDKNSINAIADETKQGCTEEEFKAITKKINRAALQNTDRKKIFDNAIKLLLK